MNHSRLLPSFLIAAAMTVLLLTAARADDADIKLTVDRQGAVSHDDETLSLDELRDYARGEIAKDKQTSFIVAAPADIDAKSMQVVMDALRSAGVTKLALKQARAEHSADSDPATIKFSDPSKPGTLKISVTNGDIHLRGNDAAEIRVTTDLKPETPELRKDGLRVLTSSSSYSLTEKNNVAVLSYGTESWPTGGGDFTITVPRNTAIVINSNFGGDVDIGNVTGNIEVKNLNGEVNLNDIDGAALVETMNGEIHASVVGLHEGKPLSFTSMNGEVVLHLPAETKANVRLRTHNGSILTDFDDKALVTKTESVRVTGHSHNRAPKAVVVGDDNNAEMRAAVNEAVRAGAEAAHEAAIAIKEAAAEARVAAHEAARAAKDYDSDSSAPMAPMAPLPPLPPMTGGKIVAGTLNGGGPEIRITTMNGDVTLRRIEAKK